MRVRLLHAPRMPATRKPHHSHAYAHTHTPPPLPHLQALIHSPTDSGCCSGAAQPAAGSTCELQEGHARQTLLAALAAVLIAVSTGTGGCIKGSRGVHPAPCPLFLPYHCSPPTPVVPTPTTHTLTGPSLAAQAPSSPSQEPPTAAAPSAAAAVDAVGGAATAPAPAAALDAPSPSSSPYAPVPLEGYTPGPVEVGWEVWVGFAAGIIPFAIGSYEFLKRIVSGRGAWRGGGVDGGLRGGGTAFPALVCAINWFAWLQPLKVARSGLRKLQSKW